MFIQILSAIINSGYLEGSINREQDIIVQNIMLGWLIKLEQGYSSPGLEGHSVYRYLRQSHTTPPDFTN